MRKKDRNISAFEGELLSYEDLAVSIKVNLLYPILLGCAFIQTG